MINSKTGLVRKQNVGPLCNIPTRVCPGPLEATSSVFNCHSWDNTWYTRVNANFSQSVSHSLGADSDVSGFSKLIPDPSCTLEWVSQNHNCQIPVIYSICGPWSTRTTTSAIALGFLESSPNVSDAALTDPKLCGYITLSSAILDHLTCSRTLQFSQMHPNT
mgnify:FL=1